MTVPMSKMPPQVTLGGPVFTTRPEAFHDIVWALHVMGLTPSDKLDTPGPPGSGIVVRRVRYLIEAEVNGKKTMIERLILNNGLFSGEGDSSFLEPGISDLEAWLRLKPLAGIALETLRNQDAAEWLAWFLNEKRHGARVIDGQVVNITGGKLKFVGTLALGGRIFIPREPPENLNEGFVEFVRPKEWPEDTQAWLEKLLAA